jgi:anti-sigma-K factor RskA
VPPLPPGGGAASRLRPAVDDARTLEAVLNAWSSYNAPMSRVALVLIALALIVGGALGVLGAQASTDDPAVTPARETNTVVVATLVVCDPGRGRSVKCQPVAAPGLWCAAASAEHRAQPTPDPGHLRS